MLAASRIHGGKRNSLPPGPRGLPFVGNVVAFRRDQLGYLLKLQRTYGRMATISIGRTPVVLLFRPEHVRYILAENPGNFTNREVAGGLVFGNLLILSLLARSLNSKVAQGLQDLVGDGLLTTDGDFHDRHRRLMQAAFSKRRVERHAGLIVQYSQEAMEPWRAGAEMDLTHHMQALILRISGKVLLDLDLQHTAAGRIIEGVLEQPLGLLEAFLNLPINLPFTPHSRRLSAMRDADVVLYSVIARRLAEGRDAEDILSVLLQAGKEADDNALTRKQIRDELASLLAAGYETTTNTVLWTFYLLAQHPATLQRVHSELQSVLGDRHAQVDDLHRLVYLDAVIKESMRLYPSAWTQGRHAVEDFDLDGYHFPSGTLLMFSQWVLHRLPEVWGDPEVFRPERWNAMREQKLPHWAYFPFGVGPRSCLGMSLAQLETRLVVATVLQRFSPVLVPGTVVSPMPLITLRMKPGLRLRMTPAPTLVPAPIS